jgi:putative DNA primase/helicase
MLGYSMLTTCKFESFILLIGSGSNGKSVFLDVVRAMLGQANVSGVQPSQFGQRFQRAHLLGKLANIITEVSEGYVLHDAELKAIVSGELMTAEFKGKDPFDFAPYATCWFGTNHLPATRDFSSALFRRAIVVSFNRSFTEADRDPDLKGKLLQELPGILNLVLNATQELFTKGRFRAPASSNEIKKKWRFDADQVAQFINDCCRLECGSSVISSVLYNEYRCWARDNGIKNALGHARFSARVANFTGCSLSRGTGGVRMIRGVFPKS